MCGTAPFERPNCHVRVLSALLSAILLTALLSAVPAQVRAEERANLPPNPGAPTALGAPFLPSVDHTDSVTERAALLVTMDRVTSAQRLLWSRQDAAETVRILESQQAGLERDLDALNASDLASPTAAFGIDVGVFPVDELRKPFHNDWNDPRSGGRRHRGTDLLAQMGVPLRAIEDGTFERSTNGSLGGLSVYLLGESGARYYYAHLSETADLVEGQQVYAGQRVGSVGDSGNSAGSPHLHIQWDPDGGSDWKNPYPLLAALFGDGESTPYDAFGPPNARP